MNKRTLVMVSAVMAVLAGSALAEAPSEKWGTLTGRFVYEGVVPVKPLIEPKMVPSPTGPIVDESLVVNAEHKGLANVVVWLFPALSEIVMVHPEYEAAAKDKIAMHLFNYRFDPHVVALRSSQTLVVNNVDPVDHALKMNPFVSPAVMKYMRPGTSTELDLAEDPLPITGSCTVYAWMRGYVVVKDHPYVAISDREGKFSLKNLPAGEWNFKVWQEASGYVRTINGAALKKGVWAVTVKEGANDAGKLVVTLK